jgi:hypothetical protein
LPAPEQAAVDDARHHDSHLQGEPQQQRLRGNGAVQIEHERDRVGRGREHRDRGLLEDHAHLRYPHPRTDVGRDTGHGEGRGGGHLRAMYSR